MADRCRCVIASKEGDDQCTATTDPTRDGRYCHRCQTRHASHPLVMSGEWRVLDEPGEAWTPPEWPTSPH